MEAAARIGAYQVQPDGSLVARYSKVQEKDLGLTHRTTVGPKWVDAHDCIESDNLSSFQLSLAAMMEEEFTAGGDE